MAHRAVIAMRYWAVPNAMCHCRSEFESSVTITVMNSVKWSKSSGSEPLVSSFSKKQWSRSSPEPLEFRRSFPREMSGCREVSRTTRRRVFSGFPMRRDAGSSLKFRCVPMSAECWSVESLS
eukprot:scaffold1468_cov71-Cyclotella_meneghiniana.AAC.9